MMEFDGRPPPEIEWLPPSLEDLRRALHFVEDCIVVGLVVDKLVARLAQVGLEALKSLVNRLECPTAA